MQAILATGADARFFRSLQQLLLSLARHRLSTLCRCLVYDLGLEEFQVQWLRELPWVELRDYRERPGHLQNLGNYGWKPTLIAGLAEEFTRPVLWLDSACVVVGSLQPVWDQVARHGLWVPYGGGARLEELTYPTVLHRLQVTAAERQLRLRAGGVGAYDGSRPEVLEMLRGWRQLAAQEEILAPRGASLAQHRYDQSLLTLLISRSGLNPSQAELDISSNHPVPYLRSRNKVSNRVPLWLDPLVRVYFRLWRWFDVRLRRWRYPDSL